MPTETTMRERLASAIAKRDAERGRPLTAGEQLDNLSAALAACPACGAFLEQACKRDTCLYPDRPNYWGGEKTSK